MKVGVVGLGNMGLGIAGNLINKGYEVYGFDVNPERQELFRQKGGHPERNAAEVGREAEAVVLMVFSPDNLRDAVAGDGGLLETLKPGSALIVTATVGPDIIREILPLAEAKGVSILDAPLMAGVDGAAKGQMHVLVGADKETVRRYRELLDAMGSEFYYVGDRPGMGQDAKLCLQTLFSLEFESAFELTTLIDRLGLAKEEMHRLFENSGSASELYFETEQNARDRVFTNTNNPLSILDKDIHLAISLAEKKGLDLPAVRGTGEVFRKAMGPYAKEDIWAAVKVIEGES